MKKIIFFTLLIFPFTSYSADFVFDNPTFWDIESIEWNPNWVPSSSPIYNSDYNWTQYCVALWYTYWSKNHIIGSNPAIYNWSDWELLSWSAWTIESITCQWTEVLWCMDETAENYNSSANTDDGSCIYSSISWNSETSSWTIIIENNYITEWWLWEDIFTKDDIDTYFTIVMVIALFVQMYVWIFKIMTRSLEWKRRIPKNINLF